MQNDVYFTIVYFIDNQLIFKILRYTTAYSSQSRSLRKDKEGSPARKRRAAFPLFKRPLD